MARMRRTAYQEEFLAPPSERPGPEVLGRVQDAPVERESTWSLSSWPWPEPQRDPEPEVATET